MTLEEAKKLLKKEFAVINLHKSTEPFEFDDSNWFGYEKPAVLEAFRVLAKEGYYITISGHDYDMRKKRLDKEYELNTKAPGPGEEQPEEKKGIIYPTTFPKADFYHKHVLNEGNPALAEAATQFNDALLDEQAKKIEKLANENERLKDQIAILDACKKHNDKIDRLQIKRLGKEIARLNGIIHDKNEEIKRKTKGCCELITENVDLKNKLSDKDAVLADVAEELRLSKIREKNLTEVCQKYMKETEELKKKLAGKVVDKINAQALKSAESALAYKEKVIADLGKELKRQKALADHISKKYDGAKINLKVRTEGLERLEKELEEKTKLIEMIRKGSKEYCDYGIAAEKMIQKMAKVIVEDRAINAEDFEEYRRLANGYRFNPQLPELSEEETAKILDFNAKCMRAARESINDVFESYAAKYAKSTLDELKENAYNSFNAKAHNLGLVGSKDDNGIIDQIVGVDIAEEGADHSDVIVMCGKDFIDAIKKMK